MELHRLTGNPTSGGSRRVDLQIGVRERAGCIGQPEETCELLVRTHRDQVSAAVHPIVSIVTWLAFSGISPRIATS